MPSAYGRFEKAAAAKSAADPSLSAAGADRAVFMDWIDAGAWDDLLAYYHENYDVGVGGEWELIELSHRFLDRGDTTRLDAMWRQEIALRLESLKNARKHYASRVKDKAQQIDHPLPVYYGPLAVRLRMDVDPAAKAGRLEWALATYARLMLRDRHLSDLLEDDALRVRRDWVFEQAHALLP